METDQHFKMKETYENYEIKVGEIWKVSSYIPVQ